MKECLHETTSFARARAAVSGPRLAAALVALSFAAHPAPASAQFKLQQTFTGTTAPGWTLSGNAFLTAPSIDPDGQGWLRLTDAAGNERGLALDTAETFAGDVPVSIRFNYVSWGGNGADGITVFLYDATQNMSGAANGGGLGYCGGAGGYLGIGMDEYGNFSNPADHCGAAGGGPGFRPDTLVIRGPITASDQYVTGAAVAGGIDNPGVATRPSPKTVVVTLTPATVGYTVTALIQTDSSQPFQTLFSNVAFPYAPPATLAVGFTGSTGGSTNIHELQGLVTATPDDLQVALSGPATVLQGTPVTYTLTLTNDGAFPIGASDAPTLTDALPAVITGASWTCTPSAGATCTASGSGSLSTSTLTLPSNASVTYTITGTLDPAIICGTTVSNTASADFGSSSSFIDPDPTNNSATATANVSCAVTLAANPATLSFGPQTVGSPGQRADHHPHRHQRCDHHQYRHQRRFQPDQRLQCGAQRQQLHDPGRVHPDRRGQPRRHADHHQQRGLLAWPIPSMPSSRRTASCKPEVWPFGRSTWLGSPVTIMRLFSPRAGSRTSSSASRWRSAPRRGSPRTFPQRAPAHEGERRDLDLTALQRTLDDAGVHQVVERVVDRAQIGIDLFAHVAGASKPFAGFHCRPRQDTAVDFLALEHLYGLRDRQPGLAGAGRSGAEHQRVAFERANIAVLRGGARPHRTLAQIDFLEGRSRARRIVVEQRALRDRLPDGAFDVTR